MVPDIVLAVHALDAAAVAARATARAERSEPWQEFSLTLSGLCAQVTAAAAAGGHTRLLASGTRQGASSISSELATAARLLSALERPPAVPARLWATCVLRVQ
ncbi:MAG: hypothetical protein LH616_18815, partial [Ilumatobacteraceae bacterium]|nr:hypothetical protein [Ilumatobacteraceae bacterium]